MTSGKQRIKVCLQVQQLMAQQDRFQRPTMVRQQTKVGCPSQSSPLVKMSMLACTHEL